MDRDRFRSASGQGRAPSSNGGSTGRPLRATPYTTPRRMPSQPVAPTPAPMQQPIQQPIQPQINQPAPVSRQPIAPNPVSPHQPQPVIRQQPIRQQPEPIQQYAQPQAAPSPEAMGLGYMAIHDQEEPLFTPSGPSKRFKKPSISMPSLHLPKPVVISVIAIVSLSVIGGGTFAVLGTGESKGGKQASAYNKDTSGGNQSVGSTTSLDTNNASSSVASDKPTFKALAPNNSSVSATYNSKVGTYNYVDNYGGNSMVVTQQAAPAGSTLEDIIGELTQKTPPTTSIDTSYGKLYVYNKPDGPEQSIIAQARGVIVLVQSTKVLPNEQWKSYIESLQ